MARVRYTGNARRYRLTNSDVDVHEDDPEVDVDEETASYLLEETGQFERVDEAGTADDDVHEEDGPPDAASAPIDPSDYTVGELEAQIDDADYSDDDLTVIRAAEAQGKNRKGVRGALDVRLED
ncbi:hypothetical protein G9C85_02675 [Halorubellus sp. JP-L1]|uniref:hypothetical protein n=1 Tax=Halorubellus sp. JP-L1 TaxID=2715753 RepID=UPI00140BF0A4|nr:hypothetical protein [Halorubellus sp. JP-L1]NHN40543.1 hypothetical protein [Halorubellus sp. JP-L1]